MLWTSEWRYVALSIVCSATMQMLPSDSRFCVWLEFHARMAPITIQLKTRTEVSNRQWAQKSKLTKRMNKRQNNQINFLINKPIQINAWIIINQSINRSIDQSSTGTDYRGQSSNPPPPRTINQNTKTHWVYTWAIPTNYFWGTAAYQALVGWFDTSRADSAPTKIHPRESARATTSATHPTSSRRPAGKSPHTPPTDSIYPATKKTSHHLFTFKNSSSYIRSFPTIRPIMTRISNVQLILLQWFNALII